MSIILIAWVESLRSHGRTLSYAHVSLCHQSSSSISQKSLREEVIQASFLHQLTPSKNLGTEKETVIVRVPINTYMAIFDSSLLEQKSFCGFSSFSFNSSRLKT